MTGPREGRPANQLRRRDDGRIVDYQWDFGDPASAHDTSNEAAPSHTYATAGVYRVTLTVTDDRGVTGSVQHAITVGP
jgi:PKD repeat protein